MIYDTYIYDISFMIYDTYIHLAHLGYICIHVLSIHIPSISSSTIHQIVVARSRGVELFGFLGIDSPG